MTRLWLPSGVRKFDPEVEAVLEDSPPEARTLAEEMANRGMRFVAAGDFKEQVGKDGAALLLAHEWGVFHHPTKRKRSQFVQVEHKPLEELTLERSQMLVKEHDVVGEKEHPNTAGWGLCLYVLLDEFPLYIPVRGAPYGWVTAARADGYSIMFPELPNGERRWFDVPRSSRTDIAQRVAGEKVGRNEPCVCGSGEKSKRCCGG